MSQYEIQIEKGTVQSEGSVSFVGMDKFYIPESRGRKIAQQAAKRFDLESLEDGTPLGVVKASDTPAHHVVSVEWSRVGEEELVTDGGAE